ncbi:MAG: DNA repair protein RecN [Deltaproteobacteria bacterium]|nr:DNA repair protein RecN [Deltaproteobacteria bacterium]
MLSTLRIKNIAIVDELEIEFAKGLNVLTGETGAGKSIILKAIGLLCGTRSAGDIIRHGQTRAEVEALFYTSPALREVLLKQIDEAQEFISSDELIIRRIVEESGRGKIYINSKLVPLNVLQQISVFLLDITGQHQQQSLLDVVHHRELLDAFGIAPALLTEVRAAYESFAAARKVLQDFERQSSEKEEYFRRLAFERDELKKAQLKVAEREELETELSRLQNVEALGLWANEALGIIESEQGAETQLVHLKGILDTAKRKDTALGESFGLIESACEQVKEARYLLADYLASLEADPERLEILRERLSEIARLERKYQKPVAEILTYYDRIKSELSEYEAGNFDIEKLKKDFDEAQAKLKQLEAKLTEKRREAAKKLQALIEKELVNLNMKKARFSIEIKEGNSSAYGADSVEFLLAANPGEPFKPLAKVASGGELSRVLLVLKTILNKQLSPMLQVFDEVDSGIGGAVAEVVGEKLREVSKGSQVLLITHAPQIAALADSHYLISKVSSKDSTSVSLAKLPEAGRVTEIARMLAGKNVTEKFHESARELLRHSSQMA